MREWCGSAAHPSETPIQLADRAYDSVIKLSRPPSQTLEETFHEVIQQSTALTRHLCESLSSCGTNFYGNREITWNDAEMEAGFSGIVDKQALLKCKSRASPRMGVRRYNFLCFDVSTRSPPQHCVRRL